jgi:hypothetical protein
MIQRARRSLARMAAQRSVLACGTLLLASPQSDRKAAGKTWTMSRTPDGQPDLQGMWTDYDSTPFERLSPGEEVPRGPAVSTADWLVQTVRPVLGAHRWWWTRRTGGAPLKREAIEKKDALLALGSDSPNTTGRGSDVSPAACGSMGQVPTTTVTRSCRLRATSSSTRDDPRSA